MKRYLFLLLALFALHTLSAQELRFKSFECRTTDLKAKVNPQNDGNGNPCALIRVCVALKNPTIDGNMGNVGEMQSPKPSQYEVYVPAGTRRIRVCHPDYLPFTHDFNMKIEGLKTYELYITVPEAGPTKPEVKTHYLLLKVSPSNATVLIDGMPQTVTNGGVSDRFDLGTHSYYISAPQHYPQEGDFTIIESNRTDLSIELQPSHLPLNLRVTPANATVLIDGKMLELSGGSLTQKFEIGKHRYQIMASQYHTQSGEFEITSAGATNLNIDLKPAFGHLQVTSNTEGVEVYINGEKRGVTPCKVQLPSGQYDVQLVKSGYISYFQQVTISDGVITPFGNALKANFAQVTLKAPFENSEIWVNDQFKAKGSWSGRLDANTYLVETRTEGYENASENIEVVAEVVRTYTLQTPRPIYGMVEITSDPFEATIKLDGKVVGTTPWQSNEVLVGKHTLELSKEGYETKHESFTLIRETAKSINQMLKKKTTSNPATTSSGHSSASSSPLSATEIESLYQLGVGYFHDGKRTEAVKYFREAAEAGHERAQCYMGRCYQYGYGVTKDLTEATKWYRKAAEQGSTVAKKTLINMGVLENSSSSSSGNSSYTSRTTSSSYTSGTTSSSYAPRTTSSSYTSGTTSSSYAPHTTSSSTKKTYKVGDYYNENGKQGVVFWVDDTGKHGKIVSMKESSYSMRWTSDGQEQKRLIGADSKTDGAKNMATVKKIYDWRSKYSAFLWCTYLGDEWYLPAIKELEIFTLNDKVHNSVNRTLAEHGGEQLDKKGGVYRYWSSTESDKKFTSMFCAWYVDMYDGSTGGSPKLNYYYVRAVSAF